MADEAKVTVVFMIRNKSGAYEPQEFHNIQVNAKAPVKRLLPDLVAAFPEFNLEASEVELLVQASDGSSLSSVAIEDGCRLVVFPKYGGGPLVRR